ncbi:MAG: hypothetical protein WD557_05915 [Dehalococcoidia bacterium]
MALHFERLRLTLVPGGLALLALVFAGALVGCGGDDDGDDETPTPAATSTSQPTSTPEATSSRPAGPTPVQPTPDLTPRPSGGELIDAVITAVETQDAAGLERLMHYFLAACTGTQGIGAIPCPDGQPAGSAVDVFGVGGCEGTFIARGDPDASRSLQQFVLEERALWAVVETPPFPGDERVPGKHMVIFRYTSGPSVGGGTALSVDEEGVSYLHTGCGPSTTPESFTHGSTEYLIPPQ